MASCTDPGPPSALVGVLGAILPRGSEWATVFWKMIDGSAR